MVQKIFITKMNFSKIKFKNIAYLFSCAIFFIMTSCEEDLTKGKAITIKTFLHRSLITLISYRDSGFVTLKAKLQSLKNMS
jgi:hypothetical protein